jgi:hypothetical protein
MEEDEWGKDATVQTWRRLFASIERALATLLAEAGLKPFDKRLGRWRKAALGAFERRWAASPQQGMGLEEKDLKDLYLRCLEETLREDGDRPGAENPVEQRGRMCSSDERALIRLRLFGRCRIYHDPVSPVLRAPAQVGWDAWFRRIDLITPQTLKGEELLRRTRGWWTVEPNDVAEVVKQYGRLVVGEQGELMVEFADEEAARALSRALKDRFDDQVLLTP